MNQRQSEWANAKQKRSDSYQKTTTTTQMLNQGKLPPQATDLEASVLGACMLEPNCLVNVIEIIQSPEVFYSDIHKIIYTAITGMFERGTTIDMLTVTKELQKLGKLDEVGGMYAIGKLLDNVAESAHVEEWARIIVEKHIARELIKFGYETASSAYDDSNDVFDLLDTTANFANAINEQVVKKQYVHVAKSVEDVLIETAELMNKEVKLSGITTGFREMDNITSGWQKQQLIIIAARPSVGKTAYELNLAYNCATDTERGGPVGLFSMEMSHDQLTRRLLANHADIALGDIRNGQLTQTQFEQLTRKAEELKSLPIYIDDTAGLTTLELRAKARRMVNVHGVKLIIIDYLQLMRGNGGNREQEISKISRELKIMAKTLDIPVIALSQLSRAVEGRSDPEPKLSDLRESGAIEQDADVVMFLYNHPKEDIKKFEDKKHERLIKIAKQRDGQLAEFIYKFNGSRQRFYSEEMCVHYQPVEPFDSMPIPEPTAIKRPDFTPNLLPLMNPSEEIRPDELPF